ncbi:hypothetical protein SteCoe_8125 [Stentor coeruleus]|uniref:Uncharacterized protein n=1 Tax=Stentor coeruleus TaxID=5963 RepID=A0A1R2CKW8_9CILI|nr:hypothetical protein SteCoe_8125 [Stentor coeruleus]
MYLSYILLIYQVQSLGFDQLGTIWPAGSLPISNSYTNLKKTSDYTFTFSLDHSLDSNSKITVKFPSQFISNLGISLCLSSLGTCTVSDRTVTTTLSSPLYRNRITSLIIYNINNPDKEGGTGNFELKSWKGNNLIDSNSIFGVAGISQAIGSLLSAGLSIIEDDSSIAGATSRYEFKFRLYRPLDAWNWIRFTFPNSGFEFASNPTCTSFNIEGYSIVGNLTCFYENSRVTLVGISEEIPAFKHVGVRITVKNPPYAIVTGTFAIETGKNGTLTVYDEKFDIEGVTISPGLITQISLVPANSSVILARDKEVLYRLTFLSSNNIPNGGIIQIIGTYYFAMTGIYYIEYGIDDVDFDNPAICSYDSLTYTLTISSFIQENPRLVSLLISLKNPSIAGVSDPLIIRTLKSDGVTIIDENTDEAFVYVDEITSPSSSSVTFPLGNQATGLAINFKINFAPQYEVPALGYVVFTVPYGFSSISYSQTCYAKPTNELELSSPSCFYLNGKVTIQLYSDATGSYGKFEAGIQSYVRITTLISPKTSGTYLFDYSTYSKTYDLIETGTAIGLLSASSITPTITLIHAAMSTPTIIEFQFTTSKQIPSGITPSITTDLIGFIELQFPTYNGASNLFAINLGLTSTSVPCSGISGIDKSITCFITSSPSSPSTPVYIQISGFSEISSGTLVKIYVSGIKYVSTANAPTFIITTYKKYNRVRYDLETGSAIGPIGQVLPAVTLSGSSLTLSDKTVLHTATLSTGTSFTTTVASGAITPYILIHIYISHDQGYCNNASISCYLDSVLYTCTCYQGADMVLIPLSSSYLAASHTIQIVGIVNPESVPLVNDDLYYYIIGGNSVKQYISFSGQIPKLNAGGFSKTKITPGELGQGYVFVSYSVLLVPNHYIPKGGSIQIVFPSEYTLSSSNPKPTCYTNYLKAISSDITCSLSSNTFTITGFQEVHAENVVVVFIKGIQNPSQTSSGQFSISTLNTAGRYIDQNTLAGGLSYISLWQIQTIEYLEIDVFPTNANATAEYSFKFTPSTFMGAGAVIKIDFPLQQFGNLPSSPVCRVSGEVFTFASCTTSASDLYFVTDTDLPYKPIIFSVIGLVNFDEGTSQNFVITTAYDGVTLQSTGTATSQVTAKTTAQAGTLKVSNIIFYPMNEGEEATYEFYFSPITSISENENIIIKFPLTYDHRVGDNIKCWATGLQGYLECYLLHAYTLIVTKHDPFDCTSCEIALFISGIINPLQGSTGQFFIGILHEDYFIELNEYSGSLTIISAPDYAEVIHSRTDNLYARYTQTFSFNITCNDTIPTTSSGGEVWVSFPEDYVLEDSYITCRSSDFWATGVPKCEIDNQKLKITGQEAEYTGNLILYLDSVPNPLHNILAGSINLEVYDGFNRKILARSYPNLDPTRFQYEYPGPLILINNDLSFSVRRGTVSKFIPITLDYPCALNLTLIATSASFIFIPEQISLYIGDLLTTFRVSIPYDTEDKDYIITWSILGETNPLFYTPILKSKFTVVKDTLEKIYIDSIMPIPRGANSLPVYITLTAGPNSDITIHLSLPDSVSGIEISNKDQVFEAGVYILNFTLSVSADVLINETSLQVLIDGTNAEAYQLVTNILPFEIFTDTTGPQVLGAGVVETSRTWALFTITTNKYCWCYYAYALKGTQIPSFKETKNQGPPKYPSTQIKYGNTHVDTTTTLNLNVTGLRAGNRYTIFFWAEDLSGKSSDYCQQLDFDTDFIYPTAEVDLKFKQIYLNDVEIAKTSAVIQLYLSLHDWRLGENPYNTLQMDPNKLYSSNAEWPVVSFYIYDKPDSEAYPEPIFMVKRLQGLQKSFENKLNNFDTSYDITGNTVVVDSCVYEEMPHIVNKSSSYQYIGLTASLVEDGYIYAVALLADTDPGYPFSFQVVLGNDLWNRPALSVFTNASAGAEANFTFSQVDHNTSYHIYVICTNDNPGYPEPIKDSSVVKIEWRTAAKPSPIPFSIDDAVVLCQVLTFYLILL